MITQMQIRSPCLKLKNIKKYQSKDQQSENSGLDGNLLAKTLIQLLGLFRCNFLTSQTLFNKFERGNLYDNRCYILVNSLGLKQYFDTINIITPKVQITISYDQTRCLSFE